VRMLAAVTPVWIYSSFFFSVRGPLAHAFYVVFPVSALYTFYALRLLDSAWLWRSAAVVLAAGVVFHTGLALDRAPRRSLYSDRDVVQAAIAVPNDRFLGDRRDSVIEQQDPRPRPIDGVLDEGAFDRGRPDQDLTIIGAKWSPALFGRVSIFDVTILNQSRVTAYLDIRFAATYTGAAGQTVARREGVIKAILQPGSVRTWTGVTDGSVPAGAVAASLVVLNAEKSIPATRRSLQPAREP